MGYLAATGRGTSHTDTTRARYLAPTASRKRPPGAAKFQLSPNGDGSLICLCAPSMAWRSAAGKSGGGGSRWLGNTGRCALTASRKKWTARASSVFIGALTTVPIKRELLLLLSVLVITNKG